MRRGQTGGRMIGDRGRRRRAAAAAELALLLPLLSYICVLTIDYSRLFFAWATIAECAYNGTYYLSNTAKVTTATGWTSLQQAVLADATNLSPSPTWVQTSGTDTSGNAFVAVSVSYVFTTQFSYPGIPTTTTISRKLQMAVTPP